MCAARLERHEALRNNNAEQNSRSGCDPESTAQIGIDWDIDLEVDITEPDTSHQDSISERQECRREDDTTAGSSSKYRLLLLICFPAGSRAHHRFLSRHFLLCHGQVQG